MSVENIRNKLFVTESPHIRSKNTTSVIMLDVVIALMPTLIAGVVVFGFRAAMLAAVCILTAVLSEFAWCRIVKKPNTIGDFSAVVTGLLLALNLPVTMPYWMAIIGIVFAIVIVKQFFGGLGHNFMNPALAARAFLLTSWAQSMTSWVAPFSRSPLFGRVDALSSATPLAMIGSGADLPSYTDMMIGRVGGCIGEVSTIAILIGAAYLVVRKVIDLKVPVAYLVSFSVLIFVFGGKDGLFTGNIIYHLLAGGIALGAFFMATDYTTTPYTPKGKLIFGIGCGVLNAIIRLWGGYPEGTSYAILLMNAATPLIDRYTVPRPFGVAKDRKGGQA